MSKRQKERQRAEKKARKEERRRARQEEEANGSVEAGVDPDLAGIVPGPQALPEEYGDLDALSRDDGAAADDDEDAKT